MSSIAQIKPAAVQQAATEDPGAIMEQVIALGDLSRLSPEQRARYYTEVCRSVGLNPLTKPFDYIVLKGKLTLYPTRGAADQLRDLHDISCEIVSREQVGDLYVVHVRVTAPDGRRDEDLGIVSTAGLRGEDLANAMLKAITKGKRRATLSLLGLNMPDETEVETIPNARPVRVDAETGEILDAPVAETPAEHHEHPAPESTGGRQPSREMRALHAAAAGKAEHEDLSRLAAAIYGVPSMRALSPAQLAQLRAAVAECADAEAFAQLAGLAAAIDGAVSEEGLMAVATEVGKAGLGNGARVVLLREAFRRVREALAAQPTGMPEDDAGEPDQQQPALATEDAGDANDEPVSWTALWRAFEPLGIRSLADAARYLGVPERDLRGLTPEQVRQRLMERGTTKES